VKATRSSTILLGRSFLAVTTVHAGERVGHHPKQMISQRGFIHIG
jgi:hypothetical protein